MTTKPRLHHSLIFVATQLLKISSSSVSNLHIFRVRWPVATPIQIFHRLGPAHTTQLCAVERISLFSSASSNHYLKSPGRLLICGWMPLLVMWGVDWAFLVSPLVIRQRAPAIDQNHRLENILWGGGGKKMVERAKKVVRGQKMK